MSNLYPGGARRYNSPRIFDAASIARHCKPQLDRFYYKGDRSIAEGNRHGGPHEHKREIERNRRRAAK